MKPKNHFLFSIFALALFLFPFQPEKPKTTEQVLNIPLFQYSAKSKITAPVTFIKSSGLILSCNPRWPALTKIWSNN